MISDGKAFFSLNDGWFVGNDGARGPWTADACHAGPVAALFARAVESIVTDKQLVRLTADYMRPIPMDGFRIVPKVEKPGRNVATSSAVLVDRLDRVCATATSVHFALADLGELPTTVIPHPTRVGATPSIFVLDKAPHGLPFFSKCVDFEYAAGETTDGGPTTAWLRTPAILEGEKPSPFQTACPIADCGNGLSRNANIDEWSFINPELTVALHRLPESAWLASSSVSSWEPTGIGISRATLFDEKGAIGTAVQTLLIRPLR